MGWLEAILGLLSAFPKIADWVDKIIGAVAKMREDAAKASLDKRHEKRRDAKRELSAARTKKQKYDALRKLKRTGSS